MSGRKNPSFSRRAVCAFIWSMNWGPRLVNGLKSDIFRNLTTLMAAVISGAALVVSIVSYQHASRAQDLQAEQAERAGGFATVKPGFLMLTLPGPKAVKFHRDDGQALVVVPADTWLVATGRSITVRLVNEGRQDAHIAGFYLRTSARPNGSAIDDKQALQPR